MLKLKENLYKNLLNFSTQENHSKSQQKSIKKIKTRLIMEIKKQKDDLKDFLFYKINYKYDFL